MRQGQLKQRLNYLGAKVTMKTDGLNYATILDIEKEHIHLFEIRGTSTTIVLEDAVDYQKLLRKEMQDRVKYVYNAVKEIEEQRGTMIFLSSNLYGLIARI